MRSLNEANICGIWISEYLHYKLRLGLCENISNKYIYLHERNITKSDNINLC